MKQKEQSKRTTSNLYFHTTSEDLNCAQAVLKGFQSEFKVDHSEIQTYRLWGGGRAENGMCGALFAAERLLRENGKESIVEEFRARAGGIRCSEIRNQQFSCAEYVRIADELVAKKKG